MKLKITGIDLGRSENTKMKKAAGTNESLTREVCSYISKGMKAELPIRVIEKTKHHILDTLAAMVSGSQLKPGRVARKYVESQAGATEAQVVGSRVITSAIDAAFANAIMVHADETDDSHGSSLTHPGAAVVPAALAISERQGANGMSFLKGVVVGYDLCCRITQALGVDELRQGYRCTFSMGGNFGAAAASAAILGLNENLISYALSYTAQQASGLTYWVRDEEHIQKAFVFAGMPARNGVTAALLAQAGFTGVMDPFSGERNFFQVFSPNGNPALLVKGLGDQYEIMQTSIKKFPVGFPIQSPLEALLSLMRKYRLEFKNVKSIAVRLPEGPLRTVNNRNMPEINLQHILAVALLDGGITFETAHSYERMNDPQVIQLKERITLVGDPELGTDEFNRKGIVPGIVDVTTEEGSKLTEHVVGVSGAADNPMTTEEVENKCRELLIPVLGEDRTQKLIGTIAALESLPNVRQLRSLLSAS
jgi:2-methylcitrate dehydratase PrpD